MNEAPGALEELVRDDGSRRRFMKIVGSGGAAAFATLLAACGSSKKSAAPTPPPTSTSNPTSSAGGGDLDILNYALTLEYLETAFYKKVNEAKIFKGKPGDLVKQFGDEEQQHVDALIATIKKLGGKPVAEPKSKFPLGSATAVAKLAATVENLGAAAYLGQAPNIKNPEVLAAALSIHSVEARHAAALNTLTGQSIVPDGAFGKPASKEVVLAKVKPFIVG